jgi:RNA polymerase sigma-70 factor (ECF subfamily)
MGNRPSGSGLLPLVKMGFFPQRDKQTALFGGVVPIPAMSRPMDEDDALLRRCRTGDVDAYGLLVSRHERRVQSILSRILLNGVEARRELTPDIEDLTQDVFIQAWRALPRFRGDARFSTWLYRIATNRALKEWKRAKLHNSRVQETTLEDQVRFDATAPQADCPQRALDVRYRDAAMRQAIDTLPEKQRTVILLHYFEDQSCEDIASLLGCSVGTVWSRLHYAVKRLRESLTWIDPRDESTP